MTDAATLAPRRAGASRLLAAALAAALAVPAAAQSIGYEPEVGQPGKDVVWVPTPDELVDRMLDMARVSPGDRVFDLGSGDGRMVIAAAKRGARAVGVEYNPDLVLLSRRNAALAGLSAQRARFVEGDIFETDFASATVVTLYLLPGLNLRLRPALLEMRPGTRVVSHQFSLGDWEPDETSWFGGQSAHLWVVPAKVHGAWRLVLPDGRALEVDLEQTFQALDGGVTLGPIRAGIREGRVRGDTVLFSFVDRKGVLRELRGTVSGDRMEGTVRANDDEARFTARRTGPPKPPPTLPGLRFEAPPLVIEAFPGKKR
jgi:SAM-dependent methyltransferase